MSGNNGTSVPWKMVAIGALSLLLTVVGASTGFVINSQSNQIKELKDAVLRLQTAAQTNTTTASLAVLRTEQAELKRRVSKLEGDAANLLERVLKEEMSNAHAVPSYQVKRTLKKLEKRIKHLRAAKK